MNAPRLAAAAALAAVALLAACGGKARPPGPTLPDNKPDPAPLVAATLEDLAGNVVAIDVVAASDDRKRAATAALISAVGKPYAALTVAADVHRLYGIGGIRNVQVEGRLVGDGVGLRYTITDHPLIGAIEVRGASALPVDHLIDEMELRRGQPLDPAAIAAVRVALREQYRSIGYAAVRIETAVESAAPGTAGAAAASGEHVVFTVTEGPSVVVTAINFKGNKAVKRKTLLDLMAKDGAASIGGRYWDGGLERGLLNVTAHYYDVGRIRVAILQPVVTPSADGASVVIDVGIEEGGQFKLGPIGFKGNLAATEAEYAKMLGLKAGEVFNRAKLEAGLDKIREYQHSKGQPNAVVNPSTSIDEAKRRISLTIEMY